jgi:small subunit ribosomal protein S15
MAITNETKQKLISEHRTHERDSGSPEVQIAILTGDIKALTEHMKLHPKDYHSRRGLLQKVNRRTKLLAYLNRSARSRYQDIIKKLGLRR